MKASLVVLATAVTALATPALAQPTVDGTRAGDPYGAAEAVQAVQTAWTDNDNELDAAYCTSSGARLYVMLTGNVADIFNNIEIFIDSKAGGENVLGGLPGNDGTIGMGGLGFDPGFEADYHVHVRRGNEGGNRFDLDFAELGTANFSSYGNVFGGSQTGSGVTGTGLNAQVIEVAYDNSNVAGITGGTGAANQAAALAVQTGLELSIALTDLDYAGGPIRICAFINNVGHNFASNQFLGPLQPPQDFLGSNGTGGFTGFLTFSLANFAGEQFFTCDLPRVPATSSTWSAMKAIYR